MKKLGKVFFLIASVSSTGAYAQSSVTLFGAIDTGVQYLTNADAAGHSSFGMISSQYTPSRWGLRGSEVLAPGLKAIFDLENMFLSNNGAFLVPGVLFNRNAYVGLDSTEYGRLTLGQQYTVQFDKTLLYSPSFLANSSLLSLGIIPVQTLHANNGVKYQSPTYGGFNAEAMYAFGQQIPGESRAGRYMGGTVEYTIDGFSARVVYEESRGTVAAGVDQSSLVDRRTSLAARYKFGAGMVSAGVTRVTGDLQLTPRGTIYWVGGRYLITPFIQVVAEGGRYNYDNAPGRPTLGALTGQYFLSKSTMVYLNVAHMSNGGGSDMGVLCFFPSGAPGLSQWATTIGLTHNF